MVVIFNFKEDWIEGAWQVLKRILEAEHRYGEKYILGNFIARILYWMLLRLK